MLKAIPAPKLDSDPKALQSSELKVNSKLYPTLKVAWDSPSLMPLMKTVVLHFNTPSPKQGCGCGPGLQHGVQLLKVVVYPR